MPQLNEVMYIKSLVQDLEFRKPSRYVISFIFRSKDVLGNQDTKMNTGVSPLGISSNGAEIRNVIAIK